MPKAIRVRSFLNVHKKEIRSLNLFSTKCDCKYEASNGVLNLFTRGFFAICVYYVHDVTERTCSGNLYLYALLQILTPHR